LYIGTSKSLVSNNEKEVKIVNNEPHYSHTHTHIHLPQCHIFRVFLRILEVPRSASF
jgi:hypothetical protein